jgi:hypothetical protein
VHLHRSVDIDHLRRLATGLFTDGRYVEADGVLGELAELTEGDRAQIALRRAQIGMLGDRMEDVEAQLEIARDEYGAHVYFVGMQADMAVRRGDFVSAVTALRRLGRHARADHLEGFADRGWYRVEAAAGDRLAWDATQALPVLDATVNGQPGRFVLDTGTGDTLLDSGFAQRAGVEPGPIDQAKFALGRVGHWRLTRIHSLSLGGTTLASLPGMVAPLEAAFRHVVDGPVDGIIGAGLLRAVGGIDIDYPRGSLRLGPPGVRRGEPLWIAGPHYPLTPCSVNGGPTSSWFIDSGMSGIDLACSESAARRYGAEPLSGHVEAHGGAEALTASAVRIRQFRHAALGYGELPAAVLPRFTLGRELGIRIGGVIGHEWLAKHRVRLDYRSMQAGISFDND